jgi:hypothetical protein
MKDFKSPAAKKINKMADQADVFLGETLGVVLEPLVKKLEAFNKKQRKIPKWKRMLWPFFK